MSLLLLTLTGFSLLNSPPALAKSLVLIGGGLQDVLEPKDSAALVHTQAIYQKMIELAGGDRGAKIGIITAASKNYEDKGEYSLKAFKKLGAADAQVIPIDIDHISNNENPDVVKQVKTMTGFFFGGGDQSRYITTFLNKDNTDSPVLLAIRQSYENGAAIFGISAGTVIQAGGNYFKPVEIGGEKSEIKLPMITDGTSYEAFRVLDKEDRDKDLCVQKKWDDLWNKNYCQGDELSYYLNGGFGFFNYGLLDSHLAERGRQGRIVRLAWEEYIDDAYAPDENTALVVTDVDTPEVEMSVVGERGVNIFDLSSASKNTGACRRQANSDYEKICGVKYTYLTQDDKYNPLTKTVTIANWKSPLTGSENHERAKSPSLDVFSSPDNCVHPDNCSVHSRRENPRELLDMANDLFDSRSPSTYGETYEDDPIVKVTLTKDQSSGSTGYYGSSNHEDFYSFKNLLLDFYVEK